MGSQQATQPEREARRLTALQMRHAGASYRTIAQQLGIDVRTAFNDVQYMLTELAREPAENVRALELERLDRLMIPLFARATRAEDGRLPDYQAIDRILKIMDRRAKLLGLDAPQKIDITSYIREQAIAEGYDPDEAVRDVEEFLRRNPIT